MEIKTPLELPVIAGGDISSESIRTPALAASAKQSFVTGIRETPAGQVPVVSSALTFRDSWGRFRCRLGAGRMDYRIDPGLYALGNPDKSSPVLVTANYKMSFDELRRALPARSAWILALDTKGINVWCAAGKGTFGTNELVYRLEASGLKKIVGHRKIIVPQLGAPGVAAHTVKLLSGFKIYYGPIHASDLPAYLDAGMKSTRAMREMTFPLKDRAVLIPVELVETLKPLFILCLTALFLAGILGRGDVLTNMIRDGLFAVSALVIAVLAGAVLHPILLPWIPGRAFSVKGLILGTVIAVGLIGSRGLDWLSWSGKLEAVSWLLLVPAISAYLAMNFTGCSTYTSLSGVKKEMRFALPLEMVAASLGVVFWITSLLIG